MTSIGEQLRAAREAQGLSLDDIATSTRINRTFLEELERDVTPKLPPTYVHAFIKAFAREVGLDPEKLFASAVPPAPPPAAAGGAAPAPVPAAMPPAMMPPAAQEKPPGPPPDAARAGQRSLLLTLFIVVTAAFAVSIFWLRGERPQQRSEEAPFADVVRERESKAAAAADTSATKAPVIPAPAALPDTLLLEGTARETVWVRMVTDGLRPAEYTFRPSVRMTWKGKKGFVLSLGDGAAMTFTLNGTPLGRLGVAHKPLREFPITTETLRLARAAAAGAGRSAAQ